MHSLPLQTDIEQSYRILELDEGSPNALVDEAWRKLVDEWRPDRFAGDAVLHARALARIGALNHAHEVVKAHLASEPAPPAKSLLHTCQRARGRSSFRRPIMASTTFAGVALAAVLIAKPSASQKNKVAQALDAHAVPAADVTHPTPLAQPEMRLVPRAAVTVSATLVADGRILLPETTLQAGQSATIPRLGPTYLKYSAGENLEIEIEGRRYALPDTGPSRAKIN